MSIEKEYLIAQQIIREKISRPILGKPYENKMISGIYNLDESFDLEKPNSYNIQSDEIFIFRDKIAEVFREEIDSFWRNGNKFKQMGFLYKRGIILSGPPASGKTSLLKQEIKNLAESGQIIFLSKSPWRLQSALHSFRKKEPTRPITVVIEDIDEVCRSYGEYQFLELLDGSETVNNILFIATTNNMEEISEKLKRPGRFDRKIEIPLPDSFLRKQYIEKKFGNKISSCQIERIVQLSEGLSFGHLKEIVVSHYGYGVDLMETVNRLKSDILNESANSAQRENHKKQKECLKS